MAGSVLEKPTCTKCSADIRENTQFCYNCGTRIVEDDEPEVFPSNGQPSEPQEISTRSLGPEPGKNKRAKAAEERKKKRVDRRKPKSYRWQAVDDISPLPFLVLASSIFLVVLLVVIVLAWWK